MLSENVDIPCTSVMRRGSEHGLHGLHGFLFGERLEWIFSPIVRKHKIIREIREIRVQNPYATRINKDYPRPQKNYPCNP